MDVDDAAVQATAANAHANAVSVRALPASALEPAVYDVVVSNILLQPLILLAPLLATRVAGRGQIALAGVLETQAGDLIAAYQPWCALEVAARREGWALLSGHRA